MSELTLQALSVASERGTFIESFCEAAQRLRKGPYRAGLLSPEADALLLTLPFSTPREFWTVERGGTVVGRVGACVSETEPKRGSVGFFEVDPEDEGAAGHEAFAGLSCAPLRPVDAFAGSVPIGSTLAHSAAARAASSRSTL